MAKKAGIDMSRCRLLEENDRAHFMIKRFDRSSGNIGHHISKGGAGLGIREWVCDACNTVHDRDLNAAKTSSRSGMSVSQEESSRLQVGEDVNSWVFAHVSCQSCLVGFNFELSAQANTQIIKIPSEFRPCNSIKLLIASGGTNQIQQSTYRNTACDCEMGPPLRLVIRIFQVFMARV